MNFRSLSGGMAVFFEEPGSCCFFFSVWRGGIFSGPNR